MHSLRTVTYPAHEPQTAAAGDWTLGSCVLVGELATGEILLKAGLKSLFTKGRCQTLILLCLYLSSSTTIYFVTLRAYVK
jgi:hypothetical protein